jgi:hypothetical protein
MALDFIAVNTDDFRIRGLELAIPLDIHEVVFDRVSRGQYPILARMSDYWDEAVFKNDELPLLRKEITHLLSEISESEAGSDSALLLLKMLAVVEDATEKHMAVATLAD